MNTQILTIIFVGITFLIYGIIAWLSRAKSTEDFYVAGGGVSPLANAMATAADFMSVATMLSVPGLIAYLGYDAAVYLLGPPGGFLLLGILIAPYLRKFGKFTIPDFIGDRYYSNTARTIAVICAVCITLTYLAGQMKGVGVVFSHFLQVSKEWGVIIGAGMVFFYAVLGGMKGITYTQVAQFCILGFAFLVPIIFLSFMVTDSVNVFTSWGGKTTDGVYLLDKLDNLSREFGFKEFTAQRRPTIDMFFIGLTLMLGTAGMPHIIIRYFTVPKVSDARKSVAYTLLLIALIFLATPPLAAFSRTFMLESLNNIPYVDAPDWFKVWEKTEFLSFTDKNGDGIIQFIGGVANELKIDFDITFLAIPEIANLPNWIVALVAAGALAAALSTAAGLLLVISSSIAHDLIKKQFYPDMSDKRELTISRICIALALLVGIYFGINPPGFIIQTVALAFSIAASTFFPAILMGIFFKKVAKEGAIAGMLAGLIFVVSYIVYHEFMGGKADGYWMNISSQGIGVVGMLLNFVLTILVNKFYGNEPPLEVQQMVEDIRYPKGVGEALLK